MNLFTILFSLTLLSLVLANPMSYHEFSDLVWEGQVTPGGPVYTFSGTINKIGSHILALNPNYYSEDFGIQETRPQSHHHRFEKRDSITCDVAGDKATLRDLRTVISRLKNMKGTCTAAAGPRICTRLDCAYGSYVTFCNDNSGPLTRNCAEFGEMAQKILDSCTPRNSNVVIGQYFNSQYNFNALVKGGGPC